MPMTIQSVPYVGRYTWATLPSASASGAGATAQVSDIGPTTTYVVSNGTYWRMTSTTDVYFDATTITGDTTGNDQILKQVLIPAGLLRACSYFSVGGVFGKNGTANAATANRLRIGTAGTIADTALVAFSAMSTGNRSFNYEESWYLSSSTQVTLTGWQSPAAAGSSYGNVGSGGVYPTQVTISDADANALYISQSIDLNGLTDAPQGFVLYVRFYP